jgi:hypothetical protein
MKSLYRILSVGYLGLVFPFLAILGVSPTMHSGTESLTATPQPVNVLQVTATLPITESLTGTPQLVDVPQVTATLPITESLTGTPQPVDVPQVTATPSISDEILPVFEISLAELGYGERVLNSPSSTTEYILRLPEGWELREGSFFELDFSYAQDWVSDSEDKALPDFFGDLIVAIDGETLQITSIEESFLEHSRLRVAFPPSLLDDPVQAGRSHSIEITLDAHAMCSIPHRARLIIHPTSLFSLVYNQLPVTADLALYPRPFYQRAFEPDQVHFVLPAQPTESELREAAAVAARLGNLTSRMIISGTTDLLLLDHLESEGELHEHLIVIGTPENNKMIQRLGRMGVLPIPLQERQLSLTTEGPVMIAPATTLTYTLILTNTTQAVMSSLSLINVLPAYTHLVACSPSCTEDVQGREISWSVPRLKVGEAVSYALELRLSEAITDGVLENTVILLDATSEPINVNTLTTTVSPALTPESKAELHASTPSQGDYFFVHGERAVPEHDGVVQEIVSPWDQTRAILIVTGLSDQALAKASRAMSSRNRFPGLEGAFALIQETHPLLETPTEPQSTDLTLADLGYDDRALRGFSYEIGYYFELPPGWRLTESAYLELYFTHSQLLRYENSFLNVLFNYKPAATVALSDETALDGKVKVVLSASQARPGRSNRISIQTEMQPFDVCTNADIWLLISSESRLHLDHKEQNASNLYLDSYPYPFNQRSGLADTLFVLPPEPQPEEWEKTLQLAAALGRVAGGPNFAPAVAVGDNQSQAKLSNYHFIAIGRPSRNPMLRQVNDQLPQPFVPDSDVIEQKLNAVILRLPPGASLGYVQLIPSPWNEARALLAVTGTTDEGVEWAAEALTDQPWILKGNLALARNEGVNTIDTRGLTSDGTAIAVSTGVPEMIPVATATVTIAPTSLSPSPTPTVSASERTPAGSNRPAWLIPLVGMSGLAIIATFAIAFWQARRRS